MSGGWASRAQRVAAFSKYLILNLYFRVYIQVFSYRHMKSGLAETPGQPAPISTAKWIGWHVFAASRFVPGSTCLSRGMAAQHALRQKGFSSTMRIGVAQTPTGFLAHAWVISGDTVVVGNEDGELERYKLLTELGKPLT